MSFLWNELFFRPIYNILIWIISVLPGYSLGWAIVILTLIIRTILYIPTFKSLKAQTSMQEIQPKIQELKKKYKNDSQKLSEETMKLYKEHGVNPCGSCLPILIQMPILIAVFQVLRVKNSVDNAKYLYPFLAGFDFEKVDLSFYWVHNLLDPEKIALPILVGLAQFVSTWLMQKKAAKNKPKKQKNNNGKVNPLEEMEMATKMMTYMLPLMVAWFAYSYPAGLALYWFVSTLFSIAQQYMLQRHKEALQAKKQ